MQKEPKSKRATYTVYFDKESSMWECMLLDNINIRMKANDPCMALQFMKDYLDMEENEKELDSIETMEDSHMEGDEKVVDDIELDHVSIDLTNGLGFPDNFMSIFGYNRVMK